MAKVLPLDLVLVRHGQSEENLADTMSRRGDRSFFTPEFGGRHSREYRLTDTGILQSQIAGRWLRQNVPMPFDRFFVSDFIRAKETAAHLQLPGANWRVDYELRERDQSFVNNSPGFGHNYPSELEQYRYPFDPFLSYPAGGGESIATLCLRARIGILAKLEKECQGHERVIVVCHGHTMRAIQINLEGLGHDDFVRLNASKEPADRILNCQILWYSRCDNKTLDFDNSRYITVRSVCAAGLVGDYGWRRINRHLCSDEELLAEVEKYPRILKG
ncbi:MAG: Phosphoglycerate mutase domain-containing protein [Candidatus Yanofskybacteria bacterium GW2011_GWA1_39_13]|uniref:phosphoglycerate mutase (2,3-diphosphoglycerate-dependent) n=1 Tax=Yanofskybacteria sp. (strain GW2011_GWA1_39_13) TaxID=1619019 RepID=A0A0G0MPU5_YANXG|nr:MAG: Phosphoglycerate mutase domain-containing protein [Candidatus Yanofskybacteria bacterium GW2011_GWA1_39_13]